MAWTKEIPANPVVAVAGATGAVGREFLEVLHDLDFPASEVRALASSRSAGKKLPFKGCGQVPAAVQGSRIPSNLSAASCSSDRPALVRLNLQKRWQNACSMMRRP